MELGVAVPDVLELVHAKAEVVEIGVVVYEVLERGNAKPEVVKLGAPVSEVLCLNDAEPTVVELGDVVSEVRTQDQVKLANDESVRFVYTPKSGSGSEMIDMKPTGIGSSQPTNSGTE